VTAAPRTPRSRDAERSREAILAAAETRFAARGFDATSLAEIGAEAGLSRGAPGYFFGSKEALHAAVLERVFAAREAALRPAVEPLIAWARDGASGTLESTLAVAVDGYLGFLAERPSFVALVEREAVDGARRLRATPHASTALEEALLALRKAHRARGLRAFDLEDALVCWVSLSFFPLAHRATLLANLGVDADDPAFLARRRQQVLDVLLHLLRG